MKVIRKIIAVSLLITLALVGVSKGAVTAGENLTEGYFAPDGSYQFGEAELNRLNALGYEDMSFAEFLQKTAPTCYDTLSASEKEALNKIPWENNIALAGNDSLPSPRYTSWWATIQLDGASLRGEAWLTGRYAQMAIVQCYVRKPGSSQYVGYAYKSAENIKPSDVVKAIAVCDPPSGTYIATGNFTWNTTDENGNVIPYGYSDNSNSISYVNPHG